MEWIRHLIDYGGRMGGGMQIPVVDLDGDGDLDVVCAGKSGLFVAENLTKGSRSRPSALRARPPERSGARLRERRREGPGPQVLV